MPKTITYDGREISGEDREIDKLLHLHCTGDIDGHDLRFFDVPPYMKCRKCFVVEESKETSSGKVRAYVNKHFICGGNVPPYTTSLDALVPVLAEIERRGLQNACIASMYQLLSREICIDATIHPYCMETQAYKRCNAHAFMAWDVHAAEPHIKAVAALITLKEGK